MRGYALFFALRYILGLGVIVVAGMVGFVLFIWNELAKEASYRARIGDGWQAEFEKHHGSLASAHTKVAIAVVGLVVIPAILFWLFRTLYPRPQARKNKRAPGKREHRRRESQIERVVRYRRKAILGNYFGVAGIFVSVLLVVFHFGIFEDHENEILLGMAVFAAGYYAVVSGCWFWLKAKNWPEAIVFIAFMPVAILFVPFVRLALIANPLILLVSLVMMPLILLVVVFVLPDNSHIPKRRPAWEENNAKATAVRDKD